MKSILIISISLSVLSLLSAAAGIGAILTMPDLREYTNHFWVSASLQLVTGLSIIIIASSWMRSRARSLILVTTIWVLLFANMADVSHAILAYNDWGYSIGAAIFRILPICLIILVWRRSGGAISADKFSQQ